MKKFYMSGALVALLTMIHSDPSMAVEIPVLGSVTKTTHYSFVIKPLAVTKDNLINLVSRKTGLKKDDFSLLIAGENINDFDDATLARMLKGPHNYGLTIKE